MRIALLRPHPPHDRRDAFELAGYGAPDAADGRATARTPGLRARAKRELALCVRANRWGATPSVQRFFAHVSRLGDGWFWYALMLALPLLAGLDGLIASVHLAATGLVTLALYRVLKQSTRRPRPCAAHRAITAWVAPLDEFSFPSGHTLHAVAFTLVACAHFGWLAPLLVPFALLVAVSRVVLGLHYPSDVLAAFALGSGLAGVALYLVPGVRLVG